MKAFFTSKKGIIITVVATLVVVVGIVVAMFLLKGSDKEVDTPETFDRATYYQNEDTVENMEEDGLSVSDSDDVQVDTSIDYSGDDATSSPQEPAQIGDNTDAGNTDSGSDNTDGDALDDQWGMPY